MEKITINSNVHSRKAIAMIELIFAIVIMGIVFLSIPNLISQASQSGYTTIQQEAIATSAADLSLIVSREWDEKGTDDATRAPILDTGTSTTSLQTRPGAKSRKFDTGIGGGHLNASTTLGPDGGDMDDIDDMHNQTGELTRINVGDARDLIDVKVSIATTVVYSVDNASSGDWNNAKIITYNFPKAPAAPGTTSNIKTVTLTLTSSSPVAELSDKIIKFKAFSANIGSYKLERRELP